MSLVVYPVLAAVRDWPDVRRLEYGADLGLGDRAMPVIRLERDGLESPLSEPVRREPRVTEHRPYARAG